MCAQTAVEGVATNGRIWMMRLVESFADDNQPGRRRGCGVAKGQDSKKATKKVAGKSLKEKRIEKKAKKAPKGGE
jgi:hypothetical protein